MKDFLFFQLLNCKSSITQPLRMRLFSEVHLSFTARQQDIIPCFVESECSFWRTSRSELILKRFFQTCQGYIIFDTEFSFLLCLEDDGSCRRNEEESLTCSQFSLSPVQAQFFFSVLKFRLLLLQASRVTQLHNFVFFFPPETFGSYQEPGLLSTSLSQLIAKCLNVEMRSWESKFPFGLMIPNIRRLYLIFGVKLCNVIHAVQNTCFLELSGL